MRIDILARDYLERAKNRIIDASSALSRGAYPEVIRYSQECVELSLKAALRIIGVEYPRVHDVGDVLELHSNYFPKWFRENILKLRRISADLAQKRGPSLYGLERLGKAPSELFDDKDARDALDNAKHVYELCVRLLEEKSSMKT